MLCSIVVSFTQSSLKSLVSCHSSRPPTVDGQQAWASQSGTTDVQMEVDGNTVIQHNHRPGSLWMNIQGDMDFEDETPSPFTLSSSSSFSSSSAQHPYFTDNMFHLTVSTPTGHPHPYALGTPSSSRFKLDGDYFDLMR